MSVIATVTANGFFLNTPWESQTAALDCVLASRVAGWGSGVHFLDPGSLASLRQPLNVAGHVSELSIASGRWLVVTYLKDQLARGIAVFDLASAGGEPVTVVPLERADVYAPLVVAESASNELAPISLAASNGLSDHAPPRTRRRHAINVVSPDITDQRS